MTAQTLTPPPATDTMDKQARRLLIDGQWVAGQGGSRTIRDPATDDAVATVELASIAQIEALVKAAEKGFDIWKDTPALVRSRVLWRAAGLLRERIDRLANAITLEQGKTLREARGEAEFSIEVLEWYAGEAVRCYGRVIPARESHIDFTARTEPIGPVAAFVSWNFPATNFMRKVAGALAAGCSIVIKPAEETPLAGILITQALCDAGLPEGVLGVVFGDPDEVSRHLMASSVFKAVTFTGSTRIGRHLHSLATATLKRCTLELGGHAPVIVTEQANVDEAASLICAAKFRNAGQACVSPSRILVQDSVFDAFLEAFNHQASRLVVGAGADPSTTMGPVFNEGRVRYAEGLVEDALARGATLVAGGRRRDGPGSFFDPTVLTHVTTEARIMNEEPFGPIAAINPWPSLDEALSEANRLPVGLASYAFTQSAVEKRRIIGALDSGMVIVNSMVASLAETPFGGVNESGYGLEGGLEGIREFQRLKFVSDTTR